MFKENAIENKKQKYFEKKQKLNSIVLRNKFLGEWASTILELNDNKKQKYINEVINFKKKEHKFVVKKIEQDFAKNNIKISFKEIELKVRDFQIKANIVVENKFKLNSWK